MADTRRLSAFDRLQLAEEADRGIHLNATEVADILEEFAELELQRMLDVLSYERVVESLTGTPSTRIH